MGDGAERPSEPGTKSCANFLILAWVKELLAKQRIWTNVKINLEEANKVLTTMIPGVAFAISGVIEEGWLAAEQYVSLHFKGRGGKKKNKSAKKQGAQVGSELSQALAQMLRLNEQQAKLARSAGRGIGRRVGSTLIPGIRSGIKTLTGFGDYTENTNSLVVGGHLAKPPSFGEGGVINTDSVRFSHKNNFASLVVPTNGEFAVQSYLVHGGNPILFPMLYEYSRMYTKVVFEQIIVDFQSHTSPYSTNAAMGTVMLGFVSNPAAADYSTEEEFLNSSGTCSGRPDKNLVYGIECKDKKELFLQNDSVTGTNAIGNYALGTIQVGSSVGPGYVAGASLGRIRVAYTVRCSGVRLAQAVPGTVGGNAQLIISGMSPGMDAAGTTFYYPSAQDLNGTGTVVVYDTGSTAGTTIVSKGTNLYTITVPSGTMRLDDQVRVELVYYGQTLYDDGAVGHDLIDTNVSVYGPARTSGSNWTVGVTGQNTSQYYTAATKTNRGLAHYHCYYDGSSREDIMFTASVPFFRAYGIIGVGEMHLRVTVVAS